MARTDLEVPSIIKTIKCLQYLKLLLHELLLLRSQGLSKYKKKKNCTSSEIPINQSFYVYIIPKETNIIQIKKKEMIIG